MNWQKIKKHDWSITIVCLLLMVLGLLVIFSTTYNTMDNNQGVSSVAKQGVFIIIGFLLYFLILSIDFSWFENRSIVKLIYVVTVLLLIYVKFFGTTIANTNRWINIGFFNLQPSEYAKIVIILVTAAMFASHESEPYLNSLTKRKSSRKRNLGEKIPEWLSALRINPRQIEYLRLLFTNILLIFPLIVLTLIQPSLGNAVISFLIWALTIIVLFPNQKKLLFLIIFLALFAFLAFSLLNIERNGADFSISLNPAINWLVTIGILAGIVLTAVLTRTRILHFLLIALIGYSLLFGLLLGWNHVLTDYQKSRIDTFMAGPESDPRGAGYQVIQSKIAIGSGMLLGRGFLEGPQSSLNVLTQASTDFVFAAFAEQFGFVGTVIVFGLYTVLIIRVIQAGVESSSSFGKSVALGVALLLLLHVFINIGMNLGKLPVTGIPLPLMSYGGSSITMVMISLGLVQSLNASRKSVDIADNLMLISQSLIVKEK